VEFPRGKVIYESNRTLGYVRISHRANAVAFAEFLTSDGDAGRVVAVDRNGKELIRSALYISLEGLAWPPSGEEVWVGATETEGWADAIHALGVNGKQRIVLRLPGILRLHDISRDGRMLLAKESWRSGIQFRGPSDAKERDLSWLDYAVVRDISQDGGQVSFDDWGSASGATGLAYLRKTDGAPAIKLGQWGQPVLSPDGKQVLSFGATTLNLLRFVLLPTGVGETRTLDSGVLQQASSMGWMPDGKAVYFAGDDGQGWRMYIQEIAGSAPHAVTPLISLKRNHFETHIVSSDGKLMFARDVNGKGQLYPIGGGEPRAIPGWLPEDLWVSWSADGRSAYIYDDDKIAAPVYRLDLNTGKRDLVATLAPSDVAGVTAIVNVRMTADGKSYAYSFSRELSDLFLVEGAR